MNWNDVDWNGHGLIKDTILEYTSVKWKEQIKRQQGQFVSISNSKRAYSEYLNLRFLPWMYNVHFVDRVAQLV